MIPTIAGIHRKPVNLGRNLSKLTAAKMMAMDELALWILVVLTTRTGSVYGKPLASQVVLTTHSRVSPRKVKDFWCRVEAQQQLMGRLMAAGWLRWAESFPGEGGNFWLTDDARYVLKHGLRVDVE